MTDPSRWLVHGSRNVYTSPWVEVWLDDVEIPEGRRFEHHVLRFPHGSVYIVMRRQDKVLLLQRHRFITDLTAYEVPAGWIDEGETAEEAARREVREETGVSKVNVVDSLTYSALSGISNLRLNVFVANLGDEVFSVEATDGTEGETHWVAEADIPRLISDGQIADGPSILALLWALNQPETHLDGNVRQPSE